MLLKIVYLLTCRVLGLAAQALGRGFPRDASDAAGLAGENPTRILP